MKKLIHVLGLFFLLFCILSFLASCGKTSNGPVVNVAPQVPDKYVDFEIIESSSWEGWAVCYDKNTGVMYVILDGYQSSGITPIYNADGTLKIYEGDK